MATRKRATVSPAARPRHVPAPAPEATYVRKPIVDLLGRVLEAIENKDDVEVLVTGLMDDEEEDLGERRQVVEAHRMTPEGRAVMRRIPADYEVQPLGPEDNVSARCHATCGTCGLSWDDCRSTGITPTPSGRCPFEAFHTPMRSHTTRRGR